jgi:hypothetical protein
MFVFSASDPTFPTVMEHFGLWGALILVLIYVAILMLCELWICCYSPTHQSLAGGPTSTSAATTVSITSSAGRMGYHRRNSTPHQEEAPPIAGPPSYEELDQPPPYSCLFPKELDQPPPYSCLFPKELDQPPPCSCLFLEELDQPPPCSCLFPVTNASNMEPLTLQEHHMISGQQI